MSSGRYTRGLDELATWTSGTYRFLLLKGAGYTYSAAHDFVADLTPASNETALSGYSRQTAGTKTRVIDDTLHRITYDCADPNFGSIAAGDTISAMVLYRFVTNDADSILIGYYDVIDRPTDGNPFIVTIDSSGAAYLGDT